MSKSDDTKEIPARQVTDTKQPEPWRVEADSSGECCIIASDGQIVAITIPIEGDGQGGDDTRARALMLAKAPEMESLLRRMLDYVNGRPLSDDEIYALLNESRALIARAE